MKIQKEIDFEKCECGHIRRAHYLNRGVCDEIHKNLTGILNNYIPTPCICQRFKKESDASNSTKR
jgi:hypothetical protein